MYIYTYIYANRTDIHAHYDINYTEQEKHLYTYYNTKSIKIIHQRIYKESTRKIRSDIFWYCPISSRL